MKRVLLASAVFLALLVGFAAPASAQDEPTLTVDPPSVDAAGSHDFTVTGTNFKPVPGFLLPCPGAEGDLETMAGGDPAALCDLSNLFSYIVDDDGGWSAEVTYDVPAEGLVMAAGDQGGENAAATLVTIGDSPAAETTDADDGDADDDAAASGGEDLAETGIETAALFIFGATIVIAGYMIIRYGRAFSRIR